MSTTPRVLVFHRNADIFDRLLRAACPGIDLVATSDEAMFRQQLPDAEILIALTFPPDAAARAGKLRWIQATSAGVEGFLSARDRIGHVLMTNARGIHSELMADYVLATMVMAQWDFPRLLRNQAAKLWQRQPKRALAGLSLGVIGLGPIGQEIARRSSVFGMKVIGVRKSGEAVPGIDIVYPSYRLAEVLPQCDFLALALPATDATRHMIGAPQLNQMKRDAIVINISRGSVVDEPALIQALQDKIIAGAVLDVFAQEPLPQDNPLWEFPNVIITPHISGMMDNNEERFTEIFMDNLKRYAEGRSLRNSVDLERGY